MNATGWNEGQGGLTGCVLWVTLLGMCLGCALPPPEILPLETAAARQTLDGWNPQYCKVVEFYGLHDPGTGDTRIAYVLIANPGEPAGKPMVYEAAFKLLTRPAGKQQWFLVSLLNHAGGLTRRQGWDNLMVPVE